MQIILNIVLHKHKALVPGAGSVPFPMDIGRSLACTVQNGTNNPEIITVDGLEFGIRNYNITNCHDKFLNIIDDYPYLVSRIEHSPFGATIQNYSVKTLARPQDLLFNIPFFYIGRYILTSIM